MSETKPWYPTIDNPKEFMDHKNPALGESKPLRMPSPDEDTSPLQGSKDLSDPDSLEDVIAASYEPEPESAPDEDSEPVPPGTSRLPP